jgi:hypothetical protein
MKKFAFLFLAAITLSAVSCKKEEATISMRTRLIMAGTWRLDGSAVVSTISGETNVQTPAFLNNFTYRFGENAAFFRKGAVGGNAVENESGTWDFQQADTRLILSDTTLGGDYQITQLDDTALVIRKRFTEDGADSTAMLRRIFKRAS